MSYARAPLGMQEYFLQGLARINLNEVLKGRIRISA